MSVHSARLAVGPVTSATPATFYTCPTGKRTIVKNIVAQNTNAAANRLQVLLKSGASTLVTFNIYGAALNASGDTTNTLPWIVMNAGDVLQLAAAANGFQVVVSGTELAL